MKNMTQNIGLSVKKPTKKPLDNESNNPFAGSYPYVVRFSKE